MNDKQLDELAQVIAAGYGKTAHQRYTDAASEFDAPLSFADMKTLNATLRLYNIDKEEFMDILNRYIQIKEDSRDGS